MGKVNSRMKIFRCKILRELIEPFKIPFHPLVLGEQPALNSAAVLSDFEHS